MVRHGYRLTLQGLCREPTAQLQRGCELRHPIDSDREALAALVLEAYRGTVDDEGEDLDGARRAVAESFERSALLGASWVASFDGLPVSAVLLRRWREQPLVTFVVTQPAHQGQRIASVLVHRALSSLVDAGESEAIAFITEGNVFFLRTTLHGSGLPACALAPRSFGRSGVTATYRRAPPAAPGQAKG